MIEINKKLAELTDSINKKDILVRRINQLEVDISNKENEVAGFEIQLNKEKRDVDKLKSFTLTNLLATISGSKDLKVSKEEREYLSAKVKYDRLLFELNDMKESLEKYNLELRRIETLETEYNRLIQTKKQMIIEVSDEYRKKIEDKSNNLEEIRKQITEIDEAIRAGEKSLHYLKLSDDVLQSARNWGTADIFMSKSMITSMIKHQKIEEASQLISKTKRHITKYEKELSDVNINLDRINLEFSGVMKTFDIFFDNIFTDFSVQNKINEALSEIRNVYSSINSSLNRIKDLKMESLRSYDKQEMILNEEIAKYT